MWHLYSFLSQKPYLAFDREGKATAVRPEDCIVCRLCEFRCPDLAIQILEEQGQQAPAAETGKGKK